MRILILLAVLALSGCYGDLQEHPDEYYEGGLNVLSYNYYDGNLVISGRIYRGYANAVIDLVSEHMPQRVYIASEGGKLREANYLGQYFAGTTIEFVIYGECSSACHLIMAPLKPKVAAVKSRYIARLGFHRTTGGQDVDDDYCFTLDIYFDATRACELVNSTPNTQMTFMDIRHAIEDGYIQSETVEPPRGKLEFYYYNSLDSI